jgi:hypothetical protein
VLQLKFCEHKRKKASEKEKLRARRKLFPPPEKYKKYKVFLFDEAGTSVGMMIRINMETRTKLGESKK